MNFKSKILTALLLITSSMSFNQTVGVEVANDLLLSKSYKKAIPLFKEILETENTANINYKLGLCYFNLNKEIESLPFFELAIKDTYKKYSLKNTAIPYASIDAFYYFAKSQHVKGNIILAFEFYNTFYNKCKKNNPLRCKAYNGILQCEVASSLLENKTDDVIWNLGDTINTSFEELSPVITLDGNTIYFSSTKTNSSNLGIVDTKTGLPFKNTYVSYKAENGKWSDPKVLEFCRPNINESPIFISPNNNQLFLCQGGSYNKDIYTVSSNSETIFKDLKPFAVKNLNTNANETHISLSFDDNFLYFSSNRKGGYGGNDIYRMKKMPDGTWSKPMNLGAEINTKYDEVSPYIGLDNKTLHFSSNGPKSMGGFDIFYTQLSSINQWSTPVNLGAPFNSTDDDYNYSTTANGLQGIFSSDREEGKNFDIFFVRSSTSYYKNVTIFKGNIKTKSNKKIPKGITIIVKDLTKNSAPKIFTPRTNDGGYILNLKPCHTYSIKYNYNNQIFHEIEKLVPCNSSYQEIHEEVYLDAINIEDNN